MWSTVKENCIDPAVSEIFLYRQTDTHTNILFLWYKIVFSQLAFKAQRFKIGGIFVSKGNWLSVKKVNVCVCPLQIQSTRPKLGRYPFWVHVIFGHNKSLISCWHAATLKSFKGSIRSFCLIFKNILWHNRAVSTN